MNVMDLHGDLQEDVCRICRSINSSNLLGIFEEHERQPCEGGKLEPILADMLNEIADCHIKPKDSLPQKICCLCIATARQSFRFKRMCEQSYQFFKRRLKIGSLRDLDHALSLLLDPLMGIKEEPEEEVVKIVKDVIDNKQDAEDKEENMNAKDQEAQVIQSEPREHEDRLIKPVREITESSAQVQSKELPGENDADKKKKVEARAKRSKATTESQMKNKVTFQCRYCSKIFEQKSYLNKHLKRHTEDKSHVCPTCGKCFLFQTHLDTHMRVHTGERPFKCQVCSLTFTQNHHLKDHNKIHTGIKPFQCPHCPRTFTQGTNLKLHINLHTGKGPYKCPDCFKSFYMKSALTKHLPVHCGERPHKCPYCTKTYTKSHSLNRHIRNHTGDLFRCTECGLVFKELYKLRQHSKNVHTIDSNDISEKKLQPKVAVARIKMTEK